METLTDKARGSLSYTDGDWLGFEKSNLEASIDLGEEKQINKIGIGCLQYQYAWIFLPKSVKVYVSNDNINFTLKGQQNINAEDENDAAKIVDIIIPLNHVKARYIKVIGENISICPEWHKGAGGDAWLFVDELLFE